MAIFNIGHFDTRTFARRSYVPTKAIAVLKRNTKDQIKCQFGHKGNTTKIKSNINLDTRETLQRMNQISVWTQGKTPQRTNQMSIWKQGQHHKYQIKRQFWTLQKTPQRSN